jgi:hypothetical protein
MKFVKKALPLLLFIAACSYTKPTIAQTFDNPVDYMTAINNAQAQMNTSYMAYLSAGAHSRRKRKIEKLRQQTINSITNCKTQISELPYYKGDNSLRKSSIEYVDVCYKVFNDDYAHLVNMEDIAEQSFDEMQAYILLQEKTDEKLHEAYMSADKAYRDFAAKYNVTLHEQKSELGDKMETASKLDKYRNDIYLIFFKCNWEDGKLTDAVNKKKVNDIEQARSALASYADEGLKGLDTLKTFQGDPSLAGACRQALMFYKNEAEKDIPKVTDYFVKQEDFQKIKNAYETKASKTQQDVDAYNKAVKDINTAVNAYNQSNNTLNNNRNEVLTNWENTEKSFADAHMPYFKK